jgi:hypothetical protein
MENTSHAAKDGRKSLLVLVIIANTIILEKSLTINRDFIWCLLINVPILIFVMLRSRQQVGS